VRPYTCAGVAGIVQEADKRLNQPATADVRDAVIIGVAQRIEHYEIAAYRCARTYARRLNRHDEARLLQETLDEEELADHRLTGVAEADFADAESAAAKRPDVPAPASGAIDAAARSAPNRPGNAVSVPAGADGRVDAPGSPAAGG
jgi:hypothetical protein